MFINKAVCHPALPATCLFVAGDGINLVASLFLNKSACHLALGQPQQALTAAATALPLERTATKPQYRIALALDAMGLSQAAAWFMQASTRLPHGLSALC